MRQIIINTDVGQGLGHPLQRNLKTDNISYMKRYFLFAAFLFAASLLFLPSCKKDETSAPPSNPDITLHLAYAVDNNILSTDTLKYTNAAGNLFGVWHLEYYLSGFAFMDDKGVWWKTGSEYYVNVKTPKTNTIGLTDLPVGKYSKLKFFIGLPAERNLTDALPATAENLNMAWPDIMGGGYHFLKLEGYFKDSIGKTQGFAMHVGNSKNLITVEIPIMLNHGGNSVMNLQMNINEWFVHPYTYNFNVQGNYTMGVDSLMNQLKQNGSDVFKVIP
ncbi:MAG: hypothetical protein F9K23_09645 [Bacteroidetes bacterium]|nr:MAG: hypothetical protein F9K23_09645 [Bacteroidota bacterium]